MSGSSHLPLPPIGDIFIEFAPMMKLYVDYVNNFDMAISIHQVPISLFLLKLLYSYFSMASMRIYLTVIEIQELLKDKKKGKQFAEWSAGQQLTAQSNVDLGALLITPVQRCPRYELLLRVRPNIIVA